MSRHVHSIPSVNSGQALTCLDGGKNSCDVPFFWGEALQICEEWIGWLLFERQAISIEVFYIRISQLYPLFQRSELKNVITKATGEVQ
jgi:hypothetical protein